MNKAHTLGTHTTVRIVRALSGPKGVCCVPIASRSCSDTSFTITSLHSFTFFMKYFLLLVSMLFFLLLYTTRLAVIPPTVNSHDFYLQRDVTLPVKMKQLWPFDTGSVLAAQLGLRMAWRLENNFRRPCRYVLCLKVSKSVLLLCDSVYPGLHVCVIVLAKVCGTHVFGCQ